MDPIQRLTYSNAPDGSTIATLEIQFADGSIQRFTATVDGKEVDRVVAALKPEVGGNTFDLIVKKTGKTPAEVRKMLEHKFGKWAAHTMEHPGQGLFDKIARGVSSVAKEIAGSKVFALAASGLAVVAPILGPLAPVALGAAAAMGVAGKLATATTAAKLGAKTAAQLLTAAASKDAHRIHAGDPVKAAALLAHANVKRQKLHAVATGKTYKPPPMHARPPVLRPRMALPRPAAPSAKHFASIPRTALPRAAATSANPPLLIALASGRVRSNQGGPTTREELLKAAKAGRIFWIQ